MKKVNLFIGMAVVNAVECQGGNFEQDKNDKWPIMLISVAGTIPNRNVLSGTVAERAGFEAGKTYLAQVTEVQPDEQFGRQFRWLKLGEPSLMEVATSPKLFGKAGIFDVTEEVVETADETAKQA